MILNPAILSRSTKSFIISIICLLAVAPWFQALINTSLLKLFKKWSLVAITNFWTFSITYKGYFKFILSWTSLNKYKILKLFVKLLSLAKAQLVLVLVKFFKKNIYPDSNKLDK